MGDVGLWVGFILTLIIFSTLAGDHQLARLVQYIFVGASLGYAAVLAIQHVLLPWLFLPLLNGEADSLGRQVELWGGLLLGTLLFIAGVERAIQQENNRVGPVNKKRWQQVIHLLGMTSVWLMLGVGLAATMVGTLEGTLMPQFLHTATTSFDWQAPGSKLLTTIFTLLITMATLLHLYVDPDYHLHPLPMLIRVAMRSAIWFGKRALWVASGVIFARLVASRLSLLIARVEFILYSLEETGVWQWSESIWQRVSG